MDRIERSNLAQIEGLNQRGGRTLSIVDLLLAGTVSVDLAAYVGEAISRGASLLTAANPGGAGKTALLAAFLGLLPAGLPIVTLADESSIEAADPTSPACFLAHEISPASYYGYIWHGAVPRFLSLAAGPAMVAATLHADTIDQLTDALTSRPLRVPPTTLLNIDFFLFMHVDRTGSAYRRRVAAVYQTDPSAGRHQLIFHCNRGSHTFEKAAGLTLDARATHLAHLLQPLVASETSDYLSVRQAILSASQKVP